MSWTVLERSTHARMGGVHDWLTIQTDLNRNQMRR